MSDGPCLSIDFGTSHTVGIVAWPGGRTRVLLFDGSPLLPSSVFAETAAPQAPAYAADDAAAGARTGASTRGDGEFLVGRDAVHAARVDPSRFEDAPKRRIDDGTVLLGTSEYPISALIAAVLSRVSDEAVRVIGGRPAQVVMSHPATWGVSRRLILLEAASRAGLGEPVFVPEPAAAARYFATVVGRRFPEGHGLLVYDFGGGTFDASLVVRDATGYDVRAVDGIDDLGGLDLDEALVGYATGRVDPEHADALRRLTHPQTAEDRRHRRMLWDDARMAKERLSRAQSTTLHIPLASQDVTIQREAFEALSRPLIERTVRTAASVLRWSKLPGDNLVGVFLVGGSSRIPMVARLLVREFGVDPTIMEQPELVVAEGALSLAQTAPNGTPTVTLPQLPPVATPSAPPAATPQAPPPPAAAGEHRPPVQPTRVFSTGRAAPVPVIPPRPAALAPAPRDRVLPPPSPVAATRQAPPLPPAPPRPAPPLPAAAPRKAPRATPPRPARPRRSGGRLTSVFLILILIGAFVAAYRVVSDRWHSDANGSGTPPSMAESAAPDTPRTSKSPDDGGSASASASASGSPQVERVSDATFVTPSRNIACRIDGDSVWCQITQTAWSPPPKPSGCDGTGYGSNLTVGPSGKGQLACDRSESVLGSATGADQAQVLGYGHAVRTDNALCTSSSASIRCENTATGHGFTLAKESYTLF